MRISPFCHLQAVDVVLKATGKTTVFEGFLKAYREGTDEALPADAAEGMCVCVCLMCVCACLYVRMWLYVANV